MTAKTPAGALRRCQAPAAMGTALTVPAANEERAVAFTGWLMRVARNAALDHLRARRQIPVEEVRATDPCDEGLEFERRQCLEEALATLPEEQRKVLVLRHVLGLSPPEIAERLGKTESSVHGLHHRGRATLKAALIELEQHRTAAPLVAPTEPGAFSRLNEK